MWLCTKLGFFSIVRKEGAWHLRARLQRDLLNLQKFVPALAESAVENWPAADYRWRLRVTSGETMRAVLDALFASIDYANFKSEIGRRPDQRPKLDAYHHLWSALHTIQSRDSDDDGPELV